MFEAFNKSESFVRLALERLGIIEESSFPEPSNFGICPAAVPEFSVSTGVEDPLATVISPFAEDTFVTPPLEIFTPLILKFPVTFTSPTISKAYVGFVFAIPTL
ncbi:hypothetical protein D3C87_1944440 [compost metagenome]